jgi:hypothetical protein
MTDVAKVLYTAKTHTTGVRNGGASRTSDSWHLGHRYQPGATVRVTWSACFESPIAFAARKKIGFAGRRGHRCRSGPEPRGRRLLPENASQHQPAGCRARSRPGPPGTRDLLRSSWSEQKLSRSDDVSNVKTSGGTLRSRSYEGPSGRLRDLEVHALGLVLPLSRHRKLRS